MASSFLPDPFDSYDLYRSWNNGWVVQLVKCISLERLRSYIQVHDPYDSYNSYGSWNNGLRVVQLVNCISLKRLNFNFRAQRGKLPPHGVFSPRHIRSFRPGLVISPPPKVSSLHYRSHFASYRTSFAPCKKLVTERLERFVLMLE